MVYWSTGVQAVHCPLQVCVMALAKLFSVEELRQPVSQGPQSRCAAIRDGSRAIRPYYMFPRGWTSTSWAIAVWIQSLVFCCVSECRLVRQRFNPMAWAEIGAPSHSHLLLELKFLHIDSKCGRCFGVSTFSLGTRRSLALAPLVWYTCPQLRCLGSWSCLAIWSDSRLGLASSGKTKQNGEEGSGLGHWMFYWHVPSMEIAVFRLNRYYAHV